MLFNIASHFTSVAAYFTGGADAGALGPRDPMQEEVETMGVRWQVT